MTTKTATVNKAQTAPAGSRARKTTGSSTKRGTSLGTAINKARQHLEGGDDAKEATPPVNETQGATAQDTGFVPYRAGSQQVLIEELPMTTRPGRKPKDEEEYPFGTLAESRLVDGNLVGQSFFIPASAEPHKLVAAGRKRHKLKGMRFLTRQMSAQIDGRTVVGLRVWRAPDKD